MIIDSHVHIFTPLGGPGGYDSAETHLNYLRGSHTNVVRRARDGVIYSQPVDWDRATNFRAERFGRYEWELDGETYWVQQFSPSLQTMESSPEFMIAQMDYVGVDVAVLQHDTIYGRFNDLFVESMQKYPGRFLGLIKFDEHEAYTDERMSDLERYAEAGLPGLFFQLADFAAQGSTEWFDDERYRPFWQKVEQLGLVVYLHHNHTVDTRTLAQHIARYPNITFMTHLPQGRYPMEGQIRVQDNVDELMSQPNALFEICPIHFGFAYEYPYTETQEPLRVLYDAYGPTKFCWGSDMPNLERFCTYLQGLDFLRRHCTFISREDMKMILGGNLERAFKLNER